MHPPAWGSEGRVPADAPSVRPMTGARSGSRVAPIAPPGFALSEWLKGRRSLRSAALRLVVGSWEVVVRRLPTASLGPSPPNPRAGWTSPGIAGSAVGGHGCRPRGLLSNWHLAPVDTFRRKSST